VCEPDCDVLRADPIFKTDRLSFDVEHVLSEWTCTLIHIRVARPAVCAEKQEQNWLKACGTSLGAVDPRGPSSARNFRRCKPTLEDAKTARRAARSRSLVGSSYWSRFRSRARGHGRSSITVAAKGFTLCEAGGPGLLCTPFQAANGLQGCPNSAMRQLCQP